MHIHMHMHMPYMGPSCPAVRPPAPDPAAPDQAGPMYLYLYMHMHMQMYVYMYMHMYMFVFTCFFLVGTFWAETILRPCSQKNEHGYLRSKLKASILLTMA